MKECSGCTACCKLLEVKPLRKPAGTQCDHCLEGVGCKIYASRPPVCHTFDCLWKETPILGEDLRPDRCGIMFELYAPEGLVIAMTTEKGAWQKTEPVKLIGQMLSDGFAVWIMDGADRHLMLPQGQSQKSVERRTEAAWRRKYGSSNLH